MGLTFRTLRVPKNMPINWTKMNKINVTNTEPREIKGNPDAAKVGSYAE